MHTTLLLLCPLLALMAAHPIVPPAPSLSVRVAEWMQTFHTMIYQTSRSTAASIDSLRTAGSMYPQAVVEKREAEKDKDKDGKDGKDKFHNADIATVAKVAASQALALTTTSRSIPAATSHATPTASQPTPTPTTTQLAGQVNSRDAELLARMRLGQDPEDNNAEVLEHSLFKRDGGGEEKREPGQGSPGQHGQGTQRQSQNPEPPISVLIAEEEKWTLYSAPKMTRA